MSDEINSILGVGGDAPVVSSPSSVLNRYRDGYLVATAAVGFSNFIEILGWIVAVVIWIAGFIYAALQRGDAHPVFIIIAGIISGTVQLIMFYFFGVMVRSVGMTLRATLDTAVNSSPFLDQQQKSQAMSL